MKGKEYACQLPVEVNDKFNRNLYLNNITCEEYYEKEFDSFFDFLFIPFNWSTSIEGSYYWDDIYERYK